MDEDAFLKALGARVRSLREERGLTQQGLADLADVANFSINRLEFGRAQMRITTILKVAKALKLPVSVLFEDLEGADPDRKRRRAIQKITVQLKNQDIAKIEAISEVVRTTIRATNNA